MAECCGGCGVGVDGGTAVLPTHDLEWNGSNNRIRRSDQTPKGDSYNHIGDTGDEGRTEPDGDRDCDGTRMGPHSGNVARGIVSRRGGAFYDLPVFPRAGGERNAVAVLIYAFGSASGVYRPGRPDPGRVTALSAVPARRIAPGSGRARPADTLG